MKLNVVPLPTKGGLSFLVSEKLSFGSPFNPWPPLSLVGGLLDIYLVLLALLSTLTYLGSCQREIFYHISFLHADTASYTQSDKPSHDDKSRNKRLCSLQFMIYSIDTHRLSRCRTMTLLRYWRTKLERYAMYREYFPRY
jgi:hypothetical protein